MLVGTPQSAPRSVARLFSREHQSTRPPGCRIRLKASLVYTCTGIARNTNSGIRMGLFDHYDAGIRLSADRHSSVKIGLCCEGYAYYQNGHRCSPTNIRSISWRELMRMPPVLATEPDFATLGHQSRGCQMRRRFRRTI